MSRAGGAVVLAGIVLLAYKCNSDNSGPTYSKGQAAGISSTDKGYLCHFTAEAAPIRKASSPRSDVRQFETAQSGIPASSIQNISSLNSLVIHYANNDSKLFDNDLKDIRKFLAYVPRNGSLLVEGYASIIGTAEHNFQLSINRANGVESLIKGIRPDVRMEKAHYGSQRAKNTSDRAEQAFDRKVTLFYGQGAIDRGLALSVANTYLLDKSGSMIGSKWDAVQNFAFPAGTNLITFASPNDCSASFSREHPQQNYKTPLFDSMISAMEAMDDGSTLTVLTDGANNDGRATRLQVIARARQKGIKIQCVNVEMEPHDRKIMEDIAKSTGGSCYTVERH